VYQEIEVQEMPLKNNTRFCRAKAKTKADKICWQPAMPNGLCRMHFGKGYGAKTEAGKLKQAMANYKHGRNSNEAVFDKQMMRKFMNWKKEINEIIK